MSDLRQFYDEYPVSLSFIYVIGKLASCNYHVFRTGCFLPASGRPVPGDLQRDKSCCSSRSEPGLPPNANSPVEHKDSAGLCFIFSSGRLRAAVIVNLVEIQRHSVQRGSPVPICRIADRA